MSSQNPNHPYYSTEHIQYGAPDNYYPYGSTMPNVHPFHSPPGRNLGTYHDPVSTVYPLNYNPLIPIPQSSLPYWTGYPAPQTATSQTTSLRSSPRLNVSGSVDHYYGSSSTPKSSGTVSSKFKRNFTKEKTKFDGCTSSRLTTHNTFLMKATAHGISITPPEISPKHSVKMSLPPEVEASTISENSQIDTDMSLEWTTSSTAWQQNDNSESKNPDKIDDVSKNTDPSSKTIREISPNRTDLFYEKAWKLGIICSKPTIDDLKSCDVDKWNKSKNGNEFDSTSDQSAKDMKFMLIRKAAKRLTNDIICSAIMDINADYGVSVAIENYLKCDDEEYFSCEEDAINQNDKYHSTKTNGQGHDSCDAATIGNLPSSLASNSTPLLNPETPEFKPLCVDVIPESYLPFQTIPISPDISEDENSNSNCLCSSNYGWFHRDGDLDMKPYWDDLVDADTQTFIKSQDVSTSTSFLEDWVDILPYSDELVDDESQTVHSLVDIDVNTTRGDAVSDSMKTKTRNRKLQTGPELLLSLEKKMTDSTRRYIQSLEKEVYNLRCQMCLSELQRELHELHYSKIHWTSFFNPKSGVESGLNELLDARMDWLQQCICNLQVQLHEGLTRIENGAHLKDLPELSIYIPTASGNATYFPKSVIADQDISTEFIHSEEICSEKVLLNNNLPISSPRKIYSASSSLCDNLPVISESVTSDVDNQILDHQIVISNVQPDHVMTISRVEVQTADETLKHSEYSMISTTVLETTDSNNIIPSSQENSAIVKSMSENDLCSTENRETSDVLFRSLSANSLIPETESANTEPYDNPNKSEYSTLVTAILVPAEKPPTYGCETKDTNNNSDPLYSTSPSTDSRNLESPRIKKMTNTTKNLNGTPGRKLNTIDEVPEITNDDLELVISKSDCDVSRELTPIDEAPELIEEAINEQNHSEVCINSSDKTQEIVKDDEMVFVKDQITPIDDHQVSVSNSTKESNFPLSDKVVICMNEHDNSSKKETQTATSSSIQMWLKDEVVLSFKEQEVCEEQSSTSSKLSCEAHSSCLKNQDCRKQEQSDSSRSTEETHISVNDAVLADLKEQENSLKGEPSTVLNSSVDQQQLSPDSHSSSMEEEQLNAKIDIETPEGSQTDSNVTNKYELTEFEQLTEIIKDNDIETVRHTSSDDVVVLTEQNQISSSATPVELGEKSKDILEDQIHDSKSSSMAANCSSYNETDHQLEVNIDNYLQENVECSNSKPDKTVTKPDNFNATTEPVPADYPSVKESCSLDHVHSSSPSVNRELLKAVTTQLVNDYPSLLSNLEYLQTLAVQQTKLLQSYIETGNSDSEGKDLSSCFNDETPCPSEHVSSNIDQGFADNTKQQTCHNAQSFPQALARSSSPIQFVQQPAHPHSGASHLNSNSSVQNNSSLYMPSMTINTSFGHMPYQVFSVPPPQSAGQFLQPFPPMYNPNMAHVDNGVASSYAIHQQACRSYQPDIEISGVRFNAPFKPSPPQASSAASLQSTPSTTPLKSRDVPSTPNKDFHISDGLSTPKDISPPLSIKSYIVKDKTPRHMKKRNLCNSSRSKDDTGILNTSCSDSMASGNSMKTGASSSPVGSLGSISASSVYGSHESMDSLSFIPSSCDKLDILGENSKSSPEHQTTDSLKMVQASVHQLQQSVQHSKMSASVPSKVSFPSTGVTTIPSTNERKRNKTTSSIARLNEKKAKLPIFQLTKDDWDTEADPFPSTFKFKSDPKRPLYFGECLSGASYNDDGNVQPSKSSSTVMTTRDAATSKPIKNPVTKKNIEPNRVNKEFLNRLVKDTESSNGRKKLKLMSDSCTKGVSNEKEVEKEKDDEEEIIDEWHTVPVNKKVKKVKQEVVVKATSSSSKRKSLDLQHNKKAQVAYEKLIEILCNRIPNATKANILSIVSEIHNKRGTLKGMPLKDIIEDGKRILTEKQERSKKSGSSGPSSLQSSAMKATERHMAHNLPPRFKQLMEETSSFKITKVNEEGEICVICCDELIAEKTKSLNCGHEFHIMCINEWVYKHERTCPTCRQIALFPEEFPQLCKMK